MTRTKNVKRIGLSLPLKVIPILKQIKETDPNFTLSGLVSQALQDYPYRKAIQTLKDQIRSLEICLNSEGADFTTRNEWEMKYKLLKEILGEELL